MGINLQPKAQRVTIGRDYSINRLVVIAMIEHAVRQALHGDRSTRKWLYSEGVLWIDIVMDIHPDHTCRWLDRNLKPRKKANPGTIVQEPRPAKQTAGKL